MTTGKWIHHGCMAGACLALLAGCSFPLRDFTPLPDASVIEVVPGVQGWIAQGPDCSRLALPGPRPLHNGQPPIPFGCATYGLLAESLAQPRDLVQPRAHGGPQPDAAVLAVTRYRENQVEPLRQTQTSDGAGASSSTSQ